MNLNELVQHAHSLKTGADAFTMKEGERIRIMTNPPGVEYLDEKVPDGKEWKITISVSIVETEV